MSMGSLGGKPTIKTPAPIATPLTKSGTYTPTYPVQPVPQAVKDNINLGWNSQTGQVIQPLSPQMQAGAYTAPIGDLGIKIPQQAVFPGPRPGANIFSPTQVTAPVKPQITIAKPSPISMRFR